MKELEWLEDMMLANGVAFDSIHYENIKQALTPPTADEVCKALSEWFKADRKVIYWNKKINDLAMFHFVEGYKICQYDYRQNRVSFFEF